MIPLPEFFNKKTYWVLEILYRLTTLYHSHDFAAAKAKISTSSEGNLHGSRKYNYLPSEIIYH